MNQRVFVEMLLLFEAFAAVRALELTFASVKAFVFSEIVLLRERFLACFARERAFFCMSPVEGVIAIFASRCGIR